MRDLELHPTRRVGLDQIDKVPRNTARGNLVQQEAKSAQRNDALEQAPYGASSADIDRKDFKEGAIATRFLLQIHIVDPDAFPAVHINDLLVEQIALEQEKAFSAIDGSPFRQRGRSPHTAIDHGNRLQREQPVAGLGLDDENRDADAVFLGRQCHFAPTSASLAGRITNRRTQQFRERKRGHVSENTQLASRKSRRWRTYFFPRSGRERPEPVASSPNALAGTGLR